MTFTRRTLLTLAIATGLAGVAQAQAPAWPTARQADPHRAALPGRLGHRRQRAQHRQGMLQDQLGGHPVIVDNKPGAGTFIGAAEVARARPTATRCCTPSSSRTRRTRTCTPSCPTTR
jgi:tripartite-type tricarboxylate transporter receptor subunit TctC